MKSFRDKTGRDWTVEIDVAAIKRVRGLLGVNLLEVLEEKCRLLAELYDDPLKFVDVLYCVCKPQADERSVSDEQFGSGMAGDVLDSAYRAFTESLTDFFRSPKQRAAIKNMLDKMDRMAARVLDHASQAIEALDEESLAQQLFDSVGKSPDGSASSPTAERSAN